MRYGRKLNAGHYKKMRKIDNILYSRKAAALREMYGYVVSVNNHGVDVPIVY